MLVDALRICKEVKVMAKVEVVIIWDTGEKEVHQYDHILEAKMVKHGYEVAFGNQIQWIGIREVR